jgi:molecular chaperone Hsp33
MQQVLANHGYPPAIERLLAEGLMLAALLGSLQKGEGCQLTLQAQTEGGIVDLLVADYLDGAIRGYVHFDHQRLSENPSDPSLFALFGKGYLAITFDQEATKERYQGIVPLEGESLCAAVEHYFVQSEQIPSLIRFGLDRSGNAGAILVQHLPEGEVGRERLHVRLDDPEWDHVRIVAETVQPDELSNPDLPIETLLWRLFHDEGEVRIMGGASLSKGCRCNPERIMGVIARFPAEERAAMAGDDGVISVDCAFCAKAFPIEFPSQTH